MENFAEIESLELSAWVMSVAEVLKSMILLTYLMKHTNAKVILVITDTFPDLWLLRHVRAAAMLTPITSDPAGKPHLRKPHLVIVQTKTRPEEFEVWSINFVGLLNKSRVNLIPFRRLNWPRDVSSCRHS